MPVTAAPAAPASPMPMEASAAEANSLWSRIKSRRSNNIAAVHAPTGRSVSAACNGSPSQVPFRKFLSLCASGRPSAYRALSRIFWSFSSTEGCGAGFDTSPLSSAAIPSFAPASWFSMLLLFGAHDEVTPVTENSSMKCLRIPLSRTRLEPPRVACWDALIKLRGCVFPIASDFLLRQKRGCKAIGRWYRSIPWYQSAQRATSDEGRQIGSPTRPSIVSLIVTVRIGPGRRMWRTLPAPADRAIRVQASVDANRPYHVSRLETSGKRALAIWHQPRTLAAWALAGSDGLDLNPWNVLRLLRKCSIELFSTDTYQV